VWAIMVASRAETWLKSNTPGISLSETLFLWIFCGVLSPFLGVFLVGCYHQFPKVVASSSVMSHMLVQIHCPNHKGRVCNMSRMVALGRKLRLRDRALVPGGTELTGHPLEKNKSGISLFSEKT